MVLDIILIAVLFVWAVFGYRKGFIRQIFALAGIILTILGAGALADLLELILTKDVGLIIGHHMRGFLLAASAACIYITCYAIGRFLHNTLVKGIELAEKTNHILGMVLGIVQAALVIYFVLCVGHVIENRIQDHSTGIHQFMTQSRAYQVVSHNNVIENFDFFARWKSADSAPKTTNPSPVDPHDIPKKEDKNSVSQ